MIALLGLIDVCVLVALVGLAVHRHNRWPEPTPRPFGCASCGRAYQSSRLLALHHQAQHPDLFEAPSC